jgi:hypothetical protein
MTAEAAGRLGSFTDAAFALGLAGLSISPQHVRTLAVETGHDLARLRDEKTGKGRRKVAVRVAQTPELVAVEVDGGRLRTRQPGCGRGVHEAQNKEDKIACLVTLEGKTYDHDPQPEPPPSFLQPRRVERLVRQMAGQAAEAAPVLAARSGGEEATLPGPVLDPAAQPWAPQIRMRTCVASLAQSKKFGPMVAVEAQERDFYRAGRRAFLGDGAAYNWTLQRKHFPDFVPIADFLHVLCYVYAAAWAVGADQAARWEQYVAWLRACWQGRVAEVVEQLRSWQVRVGVPPPGEELAAADPRRAVAEGLSYLSNNAERMDYPRYRREGLPITSSLVESLVGQFNARVKDRRKFWNRPEGAEAILQVRAALLSEDGRLERYFAERLGSPYYHGMIIAQNIGWCLSRPSDEETDHGYRTSRCPSVVRGCP